MTVAKKKSKKTQGREVKCPLANCSCEIQNLSMSDRVARLKDKANEIRNLIYDMCTKAGTGHISSAFSSAEIMTALFYDIMRINPKDPAWEGRDRFILSKGQASVILYPVLADLGFFPKSELWKFNQKDGKFGVHLQYDVPGAELTSGSLGQGIGIATGIALAAKMNRQLHFVFSLLGDAELYEGSVWEAAMFASHNRLNNLVAIVDRNHLGATDFTETMVQLEPLADKWRAFGWDVEEIDGHSFEQLLPILDRVRSRNTTKPLCIIADTIKGKGISFMCFNPLWHAVCPKGDQIAVGKKEITNLD